MLGGPIPTNSGPFRKLPPKGLLQMGTDPYRICYWALVPQHFRLVEGGRSALSGLD